MRLAPYVSGELILLPSSRTIPGITPCCKSILSILSRNIDSRSGANAQQRFKGARAPIRSLQISISQRLLGDFCHTIGPGADVRFRAALRYIEALEKELGRPVLTANQVVSWHGLRLSVARTPVSGCGRI